MYSKKIANKLAYILETILRVPITVLGLIQFLIVVCFILVANPLIILIEGKPKDIPKNLKGVIDTNFKKFVTSLWGL